MDHGLMLADQSLYLLTPSKVQCLGGKTQTFDLEKCYL